MAENETAKKMLADAKELRAKQDEQRAAVTKGRPTPTQEENDQIALGMHPKLEEDGSVDLTKVSEARPTGSTYQTREAKSKS